MTRVQANYRANLPKYYSAVSPGINWRLPQNRGQCLSSGKVKDIFKSWESICGYRQRFLSISLLTPNARRQNVPVMKAEQQCTMEDAVKQTGGIFSSFLYSNWFHIHTYCRYEAKNGSGAGSFCYWSSFVFVHLSITKKKNLWKRTQAAHPPVWHSRHRNSCRV